MLSTDTSRRVRVCRPAFQPNPEPDGTICVVAVMRADEPRTASTPEVLRECERIAREPTWLIAHSELQSPKRSMTMADTFLPDDPQTVTRLDSVACIFEWMRSMSGADRKRFLGSLIECSEDVQQVVVSLLKAVKDPQTTTAERQRALMTIADALSLNPCAEDGQYGQDLATSEQVAAATSKPLDRDGRKTNAQEESFAARLKELMNVKQISQQELADRIKCSQPAISQMLNRRCRPQKRTILKLAEALSVPPCELWQDIDVADMLDAVASFQQDDYTMTAAEAHALTDKATKNRPKVRVKSLPPRP